MKSAIIFALIVVTSAMANAGSCYNGNGFNKIPESESCYGKMKLNEVCTNVVSVGAKHQWLMPTPNTAGAYNPDLGDIGYGARVQYLGKSLKTVILGATERLVYVRVISNVPTMSGAAAQPNTEGWISTDYDGYPYLSCP